MTFICEHCDSSFISTSSLNHHMKTAKYCLKLRGEVIKDESWLCECGKSYAFKHTLARHKNSCTFNKAAAPMYENEQFLQFVERIIETIAKTPTTTTTTIRNTNNLNLQPLTFQYIESEGNKHLTEQIVKEGRQPEIASKVFDGYVTIADKARKKIKYKDEEGNLSTNSKKLIQNFYRAIQNKNQELADNLYDEIRASVNELIREDRVSDSDFTQLLTSGTDLQERLIAIKNLTDGVLDDGSLKLLDDTVKCIVSEI